MKRKHVNFPLPIVASGAAASSQTVDLSVAPSQEPAFIQIIGAMSGIYVVESSLDGGTTWVTMTGALVNDITPAATPLTQITGPGLYAYFLMLPTRIRCTSYTSGTPAAVVSYCDDTPYG